VHTAPVVPTPDGRDIVSITHPTGEQRFIVAFEWMNGHEPPEDRLVDDFSQLGAIAARLHQHAREWQRPSGFTRFTWDFDTSLGDRGHWGRWQDGLGMGPTELEVLGRGAEAVRRRLAAFGQGPDRFGLIHADMRLANLLVDGDSVCVIDFDDCGFSWYLYDLGSSLSFIEHHPLVPSLIDAWVTGYRTVAPLSAEEEAELPTFAMLRRLLLVAWIGSHAAVPEAQALGSEFTTVSCDLAETYLSTFG
jgi:Ser/Thr protein kinase RdoA (MazF antagonist)